MVLSVVSTLLSLKPTHTMVEWCMTTMVLPTCNEPTTLNKGMGNTSPSTTRRRTKSQWSEECGSSSFPKTPLFHSSNIVLAVLSHSQPPFPFFQWCFHEWKSQCKCDEWCCFGKHMMSVWMVLMSHNEPHHNHNTHHVCLPAFHSLCFPFTSTFHTTVVHRIVSPMMCSAIQQMVCAIHLSLQHNHTHTLASPHKNTT